MSHKARSRRRHVSPDAAMKPIAANRVLISITSIALLAACFTKVGIPFAVIGAFFLFKTWSQAVALVQERDQALSASAGALIQVELLEESLTKLGGMDLIERQRYLLQAQAEADVARRTLKKLEGKIEAGQEKLMLFRTQVVDLQAEIEVNDYGLYNFENPSQDSVKLGGQLKELQESIKSAVRNKNAAHGAQGFSLDGSTAKGRKMVDDMTKLLLRAFNAEAENCIKTVKAGRLTTAETRLDKSAAAVARLGKTMSIEISSWYLVLRKQELELTHRHLAALSEAKEIERAEREQQRDDDRAKKEYEISTAKQVKEVRHFEAAVQKLREAGDFEAAAVVEEQLLVAQEELEDIKERGTLTRAGHVYVISNVGAFGQGMVKIGMTRRLNPEDRVRELGDASVPFRFDQHAMIFSKDAYALETALHNRFSDRRVNLVNRRREYFYVTPAEVKSALQDIDFDSAHVLEFHEDWSAPEFTQSKLLRNPQADKAELFGASV